MNRSIVFYILVPSISLYIMALMHFLWANLGFLFDYQPSEVHVIFTFANITMFLPLSISGLLIVNSYTRWFTSKGQAFLLLYSPVMIVFILKMSYSFYT